jgi:tetratricopeptide (TPR) repeat protein
MKKVLCLLICLLALGTIYGEGKDLLNSYFNDSSLENIKAILEDAHQSKDLNESNLNLLLVHYNEMNKAINELEKNSDSLLPAQRFQLANTYLSLGKSEQAIAHYDFLNKSFANWSCPWRHKGEAYYNLEDWENAETALTMAIETRIEHYDAYLWLARVQLKLNNNKEALKTFETAMHYKGKDIEDPEEEFSSEEEKFLKLEILKVNKMKKEQKKLEKTLKEEYPESEYWEK